LGCDIHLAIETRNKEGKWEWAKKDQLKEFPYGDKSVADSFLSDRNYSLFGFLFGVRNESINPWPPFVRRGIPDDSYFKDILEETYWLGDHSFTYFTKKEWDEQVMKFSNVVSALTQIDPGFLWGMNKLLSSYYDWKYDNGEGVRVIVGFDN